MYRDVITAIRATGRPFYAVLTPAEEKMVPEILSANWKRVTSLRRFNVWSYGDAAAVGID